MPRPQFHNLLALLLSLLVVTSALLAQDTVTADMPLLEPYVPEAPVATSRDSVTIVWDSEFENKSEFDGPPFEGFFLIFMLLAAIVFVLLLVLLVLGVLAAVIMGSVSTGVAVASYHQSLSKGFKTLLWVGNAGIGAVVGIVLGAAYNWYVPWATQAVSMLLGAVFGFAAGLGAGWLCVQLLELIRKVLKPKRQDDLKE